MKNKLLGFGFLVSLSVAAQEESPACNVSDESFDFRSKSMTFDQESKTLTFNNDACYKDGIIEIKGAEQIIYDRAKKEIIATGTFNFTIDSAVEVTGDAPLQKLTYKIGETIAYLE